MGVLALSDAVRIDVRYPELYPTQPIVDHSSDVGAHAGVPQRLHGHPMIDKIRSSRNIQRHHLCIPGPTEREMNKIHQFSE